MLVTFDIAGMLLLSERQRQRVGSGGPPRTRAPKSSTLRSVHHHKSFVARLFIHLDHHHHCSIEVVHFAVHHHKSMTPLWSIISIIHYPLYPVHYDLLLMALVGPIPQLFPFLSPHKHSNDLWTNVDTLPFPLLFSPIWSTNGPEMREPSFLIWMKICSGIPLPNRQLYWWSPHEEKELHKAWTDWWETLKIFLILSKVMTRFQALPKFCGVAKVDVNFGQRRLKRERSDELMLYKQTSDLMTVMDS